MNTTAYWYLGETVYYTVPEGVEVLELGYVESGYDCDIVSPYRSCDSRVNRLLDKCCRTLYVCMRDNFMDCPDRERGQWIGDVSAQVSQVFHVLSPESAALVRKAIDNFIRFRRGARLIGNIPGVHSCEFPSQSLNAISSFGMIAVYYAKTQDRSVLEECYEPAVQYLRLWTLTPDGRLNPRRQDAYWFDHLYDTDDAVMEHAWYCAALTFALSMADTLGIPDDREFLESRRQTLYQTVQREFAKPDGYRSGAVPDDRANALIVLAGLMEPSQRDAVAAVLKTVYHATPYMEYYVLKALCELGEREAAWERMLVRYQPLIGNENSTLWEDFSILGTRNHAWSGGPLAILYEYFQDQNVIT